MKGEGGEGEEGRRRRRGLEGVNVSIGGHVTGEDILKSGCRLLRAGVDEVLVVVPQFIEDLLGAQGYRTVHRLQRRELSNAPGSAVPCFQSRRRAHWRGRDRGVSITIPAKMITGEIG